MSSFVDKIDQAHYWKCHVDKT